VKGRTAARLSPLNASREREREKERERERERAREKKRERERRAKGDNALLAKVILPFRRTRSEIGLLLQPLLQT
jgi:hypothetical protein